MGSSMAPDSESVILPPYLTLCDGDNAPFSTPDLAIKLPEIPLISRNLDNSGLDPLPSWYVIISFSLAINFTLILKQERKKVVRIKHIRKSLKFSKLRFRKKINPPFHYFDPILHISLICILLSSG